MKLCPICATSYPAGHRTCPTHGTILVDTPELPPGTMIRDCYRIERVLGKGGMGIVYLAEHTLMGEPRALKFLSSALASNPTFVQRFLQEARAANKLRHLNIAQTMELGQSEDGSFYISMEFVDGPSLRAILEQSPAGLPTERAFSIIRGVSGGLGAAHAKRMVHRDVKPENILLAWTPESEVAKVVDFGIVAMSDSAGRLTQTGRPLLTAEYAAPEQWRGSIPASELDGRTDLYSVGCMFFEMLTGRLPYHSDSYEGWFEQHVHAVPLAPSAIRPELARFPGLDTLVLKLLAKDRDNRPANVREFLAELDRALNANDPVIPPLPDETQRRRTIVELPDQSRPSSYSYQGPVAPDKPQTDPRYGADFNQASTAPQPIPNYGSTGGQSPVLPPSTVNRNRRILLGTLGGLLITAIVVIAVALFMHKEDTQKGDSSGGTSSGTTGSGTGTPPQPIPKPDPVKPEPLNPPTKIPATVADTGLVTRQAIALYNNKQYAQAQPLLAQSCNSGSSDSCEYLGYMYEHKLGVDQDYQRALGLFNKSCNAGNLTACNNLGVMYQSHMGVTQDDQRALALYTRACNGNFASGCDNLGRMYQFGDGVTQDYPRAVTLYTKSCDGNVMDGCNNLGFMYQHKLGVDQDYTRAAALYGKACDNGNPYACNNLGIMYQDRQGVDQDYPRAASLYGKACDGGSANGCSLLGNLYRTGNGVGKDPAKARVLLSKGCNMGNKWGCDRLKEMP